jgi:hypothetical protein
VVEEPVPAVPDVDVVVPARAGRPPVSVVSEHAPQTSTQTHAHHALKRFFVTPA